MARPRQEEKPVQISVSVCLTETDLIALERLRSLEKIGRSTLIRKALRHYLVSAA